MISDSSNRSTTVNCCAVSQRRIQKTEKTVLPHAYEEVKRGAQHNEMHIGCQSILWMFYLFTAIKTKTQARVYLSLFALFLCGHFTLGKVLPDFNCYAPASVQMCWSLLTFCYSVWKIEFIFNNTTKLIVPNRIIWQLAKTLPGICISGNAGRRNKEAN